MAFTKYQSHPEVPGLYQFADDSGNATPWMGGPAAQQQVNMMDYAQSQQPQVSPELQAAAAQPGPEMVAANGGDSGWKLDPSAYRTGSLDLRNVGAPQKLDAAPLAQAAPAPAERTGWGTQADKEAAAHAKRGDLIERASLGGKAGDIVGSALNPGYKPEFQPAPEAPETKAQAKAAAPSRRDPSELVGVQRGAPQVGGGGGSPARIIPGRMQLAQTATESTSIPDEALINEKRATTAQMGAVDQLTEAEQHRANQVAIAKGNFGGEADALNDKIGSQEDARQAELRRRFDDADRLNREVGEGKIDPNQLYGSQTEQQRFMSSIAVALGAFAAIRSGGPNHALNIMNKAVDDNIKAQEETLANKRKSQASSESLLGRYREILGDERAGDERARAVLYQQGARQIDEILAGTESPRLSAIGEKAKADLLAQSAAHTAESEKTTTHSVSRWVPPQQVGGPAMGPHKDFDKETSIRLPSGQWVEMPQKEIAKEHIKLATSANTMTDTIDRIVGITGDSKIDFSKLNPEKSAELGVDNTHLRMQGKNLYQLGVLSDSDNKLLEDLTGNPKNVFTPAGSAALRELKNRIAQAVLASAQAAGGQMIEPPQRWADKTGQEKLVTRYRGEAVPQGPTGMTRVGQ